MYIYIYALVLLLFQVSMHISKICLPSFETHFSSFETHHSSFETHLPSFETQFPESQVSKPSCLSFETYVLAAENFFWKMCGCVSIFKFLFKHSKPMFRKCFLYFKSVAFFGKCQALNALKLCRGSDCSLTVSVAEPSASFETHVLGFETYIQILSLTASFCRFQGSPTASFFSPVRSLYIHPREAKRRLQEMDGNELS